MKKYNLIICIYILVFGFSSFIAATEAWIDYDGVSKIKLGSNKEDVVSSLGEPILMLGSAEYDNTIYLFYNYHVKSYNTSNEGSDDDKTRNINKERSTLIKFTFVDDSLVSWEEDKMTLAIATMTRGAKNSSFLSYFSLLLNLVLLIKII